VRSRPPIPNDGLPGIPIIAGNVMVRLVGTEGWARSVALSRRSRSCGSACTALSDRYRVCRSTSASWPEYALSSSPSSRACLSVIHIRSESRKVKLCPARWIGLSGSTSSTSRLPRRRVSATTSTSTSSCTNTRRSGLPPTSSFDVPVMLCSYFWPRANCRKVPDMTKTPLEVTRSSFGSPAGPRTTPTGVTDKLPPHERACLAPLLEPPARISLTVWNSVGACTRGLRGLSRILTSA